MATISAADVKRLRDMTGAGMMDCKKALESSDGDIDKAVEFLRVKGQAGIEKRADRAASNGLVAIDVTDGVGTMVEVNCETDFVAKGEAFQALADKVLAAAVRAGATDAASLLSADTGDGRTVADLVADTAVTIGEKLEIRGATRVEAPHVASYLHRTNPDLPAQIGVLVGVDAEHQVARDVAMHAAAMSPVYLSVDDVPADVVEAERRIAEEKSRAEGKPDKALPKIVEGRVNAYFKDRVLLEQPYARDPSTTVKQLLSGAGVSASAFARFKVGA